MRSNYLMQFVSNKIFPQKTHKPKPGKERFKAPILIPFSLAIIVLLAMFIFGILWLQQWHTIEEVNSQLYSTDQVFKKELIENAELLDGLADFIERDKELQNAWLAKDRELLQHHAKPLLEELRSKHKITHFYFHDVESTCFLRVHKPERYGDSIKRFTMEQAVREQVSSSGIELGQLGTFTLRVVHPWYINGELAGYIELGEEIEHIKTELKEALGGEFFFIVNKSYLERSGWEAGMKMLGRTADWDQLDNFVVIDSTVPELPLEASDYLRDLSECSKAEHFSTSLVISSDKRSYRAGFIPLMDAGGRDVGDIIVLKDTTAAKAFLKMLSVCLITISAIVAILLFVLFFFYIGRIERKQLEINNRLKTEVEKHEQTEENLRKSMEDLEHEITERKLAKDELQKKMEELEQFNKLAVGRELRMIELKKEVNTLLSETGRDEKYENTFDEMQDESLIRKAD
ncbi:MAG: hypothetical protein KAS75_00945 [Planctomycetes bacterium]|nr:hypothetical protein [Planctomycetota bacterium]